MDYLIGHLIGDYILQTDRQAQNKLWSKGRWAALPVALYHALLWTAAIALCGKFAGTPWAIVPLVIMFSTHAIQDWTRFPAKLMELRGQFKFFRDHLPQAYVWAVIVVDNTFHLALLFVLDVLFR